MADKVAAKQCRFIIEGYRIGRAVVEQTRCRRRTTNPSGLCASHQSDRDREGAK